MRPELEYKFNPEEKEKEIIFQSWIVEFQGRNWNNPEAMPEGVYEALQMYEHYLGNGDSIESDRVKKESEKFKELTHFNVAEFLEFRDRPKQNQEK